MVRRIRHCTLHVRLAFALLLSVCVSLALIVVTNDQRNFYFHFDETSDISDRIVLFVRTSQNCQSRLKYLLQSWIPTGYDKQKNFYLITDHLQNRTLLNSFRHIIETECPQTHNRYDLCCKTAHEFELYYNIIKNQSNIEWMCRFDDDQYVNLKKLYSFLSQLNSSKMYYIGRTSIKYRLKVSETTRSFTFATYGAGVCFSHTLLAQLRPHTNVESLPNGCVKRGISDDAYIGYLVEILLNISLTSINDLFHSHLEKLDESFRYFALNDLTRLITFGFAWDRYKLEWLPVIHRLIELVNENRAETANYFWLFLRNYEREHPEDLRNKYDDSCISYQILRNQTIESQRKKQSQKAA